MDIQVREYLSAIGRKGGSSRSPRKLRALKRNIVKAREALRQQRQATKRGHR